MTSISIGKVLKKILCEDEDLIQMVNPDNIKSMVISPTKFPFISFRRNSSEFRYNKDCPTEDRISVDVIIVSDKYSESIEIAEKVRDILEYKMYKSTEDNFLIDYMILQDSGEDTISDSIVQTLTFEIHCSNLNR